MIRISNLNMADMDLGEVCVDPEVKKETIAGGC